MPNEMPAPAIPQEATEVNLLTSVDPLPAERAAYDEWRRGLTWRSSVDITAESQPHGCTDVMWSERNDDLELGAQGPFTIGTVHGCESLTLSEEALYEREGREALEAKQAWLIAREVWTGAQGGASLQSTGSSIGGSGSVSDVVSALVANHQDATQGGRSIVLMPYLGLDKMTERVTRVGNRLQMVDGTIVVPGPGFPNAPGNWGPLTDDDDPESGAAADDGEVWIYVTGPMQVAMSEIKVAPTRWTTGNLFQVHSQRQVIARWDPSHVFAGLATL